MAVGQPKFSFQHVPVKAFPSIEGKEVRDYLLKWSMKDRIKAQTYSYDQHFQAYQKEDFVLAFMQDPVVVTTLPVLSSSGSWKTLGTKVESVTAECVPCSILSMAFFDRLHDNNVVRESGHIVKCLDEFYEDIAISDELRKLLLLEDSDNYDHYSESEREEFLFRLFTHICLGGSVCQYEDEVKPYLDITKSLYKDLVSVQKEPKTGDLSISSIVLKVTASVHGEKFYPSDREHLQDFSYLVVDPLRRHVTVLYHKFGACAFSK